MKTPSSRSTTPLLLLLLSLLCLSNVFVHGQDPATSATSASAPAGSGTPSATNTNPVGTASGTATGTATAPVGTGTATATGAPPIATPTRNRTDPLSSLTMLKPKANILDPPLFQIGKDIEFAWDYDKYLLLQPANLTIEAYLSEKPTVVVTIIEGLNGAQKNYTWPGANQLNPSRPVLQGLYVLRIFDGQVGRNGALPEGGYLVTYSGLKFGLYMSSPYTPGGQMNPPVCATCEFAAVTNSASKSSSRQWALGVVMTGAISALFLGGW